MTDDIGSHEPVLVPDLGSGELPVRMGCWLVDVGDEISEGQRLAELILPGTVFEIASPADGFLVGIERANGAAVECGTVLAMLAVDRKNPDESD